MSTANRTLTPSQLAALEQAYTKSPADGWRELAEAYLARGRSMEAIVVAKRGARARPDDPAPHLVLARVHAGQGKADKARAAVAEALKIAPADSAVIAVAREHGLVAPEHPTEAAPAGTGTATAAGLASDANASSGTPAAAAGSGAGAASGSAPAAPGAGTAAVGAGAAPSGAAAADTGEEGGRWAAELARRYGDGEGEDPSERRRRARRSATRTVALAVALGAILAGAWAVTTSRRARAEEQQRLMTEAHRLIDRDVWPAWRDAQAACEKAAELGGDAANAAHGCAAWAAAVRWAEHGEGEPMRTRAREHLARAGAEAERGREAFLAGAWLQLHGGDVRGAAEQLRRRGATDGSAQVRAALGVALQESGDLDGARDALTAAQQLAPGSPRIAQQLAEAFRRRGNEGAPQAAMLYEVILQKLAVDHPPSLIGKAQLLLDQRNPAGALAAAQRVGELKDQASPRQRARALAVVARALAQQGKKAEAEAAEREARGLDAAALEVRGPVAQAGR